MRLVILDEPRAFDGQQLTTRFFDDLGVEAEDALVAFVGPADVPEGQLPGIEFEQPIWSPQMAHLILEHRGMTLREGILAQRLLVRLTAAFVSSRSGAPVDVRGDDLHVGDGRLSVSFATVSSRGVLVHLGVNVDTEGTPTRTAGLRDLRIPAAEFLRTLARLYSDEYASVLHAVSKVTNRP